MKRKINIAFVSDDGYFKYMVVAIESIINNAKENLDLNIYILDTGITSKNQERLKSRYDNLNKVNIEFLQPNIESLKIFKLKTHVSTAAFSKIFIADLINEEQIIYLDCDLMLREDISKLWQEFEDDVPLKAVWNPFYNYDSKYMGLSMDDRTFNSGVMLLNLSLMREMDASTQLLEFLNEFNDKTKLHDQAAFNAVFKNDWEELDYKWNYQVSMILSSCEALEITQEQYLELYNNPSIVHFTSNSKPWQLRNRHPYKNEYLNIYSKNFGTDLDTENYLTDTLKRIKETIRYKKAYASNSK